MKYNKPKEKMSYENWCKLTGREYGFSMAYSTLEYPNGYCSINLEKIPTPNNGGYDCIEVFYRFLPELSKEENMKIFWNRVREAIK